MRADPGRLPTCADFRRPPDTPDGQQVRCTVRPTAVTAHCNRPPEARERPLSSSAQAAGTAAARLLCADARSLELPDAPLEPAAVVRAGSPAASSLPLDERNGVEVGVWQLTPGEVTDVEVDEVFVVLSGAGSVTFEDGSRLELGPGAVVRLEAGDRTTWRVTEPLRKVYLA